MVKCSRDEMEYQTNLTLEGIIGEGSFGKVYKAHLESPQETTTVAVKRVYQSSRYKNRELSMLCELEHPNIIDLKYYYYAKSNEKYLNLIFEYISYTLHRVIKHYREKKQRIAVEYVRLYTFQLMRGLGFMHARNICHRDIKPQNLLVDPESGILKICDFGTSKYLVPDEPNLSYICSRYYRAPELILGSTDYSTKIDVWSAGCVFGEMLQNEPLFKGPQAADVLLAIFLVVGSPDKEQLKAMKVPDEVMSRDIPVLVPQNWGSVLSGVLNQELLVCMKALCTLAPNQRPHAYQMLAFPFFDTLRVPDAKVTPSGRSMPSLQKFDSKERQSIVLISDGDLVGTELLAKIVPNENNNSNTLFEPKNESVDATSLNSDADDSKIDSC